MTWHQFNSHLSWCDWTVWLPAVDVSCSCPGGPWEGAGGRRLGGPVSSHHCQLCCLCCWGGWNYCAVESPVSINGWSRGQWVQTHIRRWSWWLTDLKYCICDNSLQMVIFLITNQYIAIVPCISMIYYTSLGVCVWASCSFRLWRYESSTEWVCVTKCPQELQKVSEIPLCNNAAWLVLWIHFKERPVKRPQAVLKYYHDSLNVGLHY